MILVCLLQCTEGEAASGKNQTSGEKHFFIGFFVFCRPWGPIGPGGSKKTPRTSKNAAQHSPRQLLRHWCFGLNWGKISFFQIFFSEMMLRLRRIFLFFLGLLGLTALFLFSLANNSHAKSNNSHAKDGTSRLEIAESMSCISTFVPTGSAVSEEFQLMIERNIISFLATTKGRSHLVIVDDGSGEEHVSFLKEIEATYKIEIEYKKKNSGIACAKNTCLRIFMNSSYKYIFLIDHDVYFKKRGWDSLYINTAQGIGAHHLSWFVEYNVANSHQMLQKNGVKYAQTSWVNGPLLYADRMAVEKVGGFRVMPEKWGHEHSDWSIRMQLENFTLATFLDAPNSFEYLDLVTMKSVFSPDEKARMSKVNLKVPTWKREKLPFCETEACSS
jgi:hypothetical protein